MKYKLKYCFSFIVVLCITNKIFAQDVSYSQFYSNPLYLNPAFTGTLDVPRINLQYRNQWGALSNAFVTQSVSFDLPIKKLGGGIGALIINDSQADKIIELKQFNLIYSTRIQIGENMQLSGALQAGYNVNHIDWNRLVFADNLDPFFGKHSTSTESIIAFPDYNFFDFSSGVVLFNDFFFSGISIHHLNEPYQNWYDGNSFKNKLYRKYTLHYGARIPVHFRGSWRKSFDLMPQIAFLKQGKFWQFNYGLLANLKGFSSGIWLKQDQMFNYDSIVLLVGYMKKRWHFTYSYDMAISGLAGHVGGSSEFSLGFLLKDFKKNLPFPFYSPYEDEIGR